MESDFGTLEDILKKPDAAIALAAANATAERAKLDQARIELNNERRKNERVLAEIRADEKAMAADREKLKNERAKVAADAAENAKQKTLIERAWAELSALGEQVRKAAKAMGLTENPIISSGIAAAKKLAGYGGRKAQSEDPEL
jgi:peptidoglycan hydrolase CwlO-like protein